jgi:hypothetical protein
MARRRGGVRWRTLSRHMARDAHRRDRRHRVDLGAEILMTNPSL